MAKSSQALLQRNHSDQEDILEFFNVMHRCGALPKTTPYGQFRKRSQSALPAHFPNHQGFGRISGHFLRIASYGAAMR